MPQSPRDLSELIRQLARQAAASLGKSLSLSAEDEIARVPPPYNTQSQISVDVHQLQSAIRGIINTAAIGEGKEITNDHVNLARIRTKCHYLWFC
jgi:hypothetical protein